MVEERHFLDSNLEPVSIHFRVGVRTKLDIAFHEVLAKKPMDENMSDYIKRIIVDWQSKTEENVSSRVGNPSVESTRLRDLEDKIARLEQLFRSGGNNSASGSNEVGSKNEENVGNVLDEAKLREAEAKVASLMDAF